MDRGHRAVLRRRDDDLALGFGLGALLAELRDAAFEDGNLAAQFQRQIGALALHVQLLALRRQPRALGRAEPGLLFEHFGLHLLQPHLRDVALLVLLAVQGFEPAGDLHPLLQQRDLLVGLLDLAGQAGQAQGQRAVLLHQQALLLRALFGQAGAPLGQALADLHLRGAERGALQLVGQRQQPIVLVHRRAFLHRQLTDDARPRRMHAHQPLLRQQPAVDARGAGELAERQQRDESPCREQAEQGEPAKRRPRRQHHGAHPLRLALGHDLGAEQAQAGVGARRGRQEVAGVAFGHRPYSIDATPRPGSP